jgi:hypothetical protein
LPDGRLPDNFGFVKRRTPQKPDPETTIERPGSHASEALWLVGAPPPCLREEFDP